MNGQRIFVIVICVVFVWYAIRSSLLGFQSPAKYYVTMSESQKPIDLDLDHIKNTLENSYIESVRILSNCESAKTILELEKGIEYLKNALKQRNILANQLHKLPTVSLPKREPIKDPGEICPEKYGGTKEDYPFFLQNIPLDPKCTRPIHTLVTIIFNFVNEIPFEKAEDLFEDAAFCGYKNMRYLAYFPSGKVSEHLKSIASKKLPNMRVLERKSTETSHAGILHDALFEVSTKYVIVARNTERFDNFSTIERMVRDISLGKSLVIGGAHRNGSGHWKAGCYQTKIIRGEIKFDEGYDLSDNSCMYCDYVSGPFGTTKEVLNAYLSMLKSSGDEIVNKLHGDFLYMDFFIYVRLNLEKRIFVCFDAMYYTETTGLQPFTKDKWLPFISKNHLSKVSVPEVTYEFSCDEASVDCKPRKEEHSVCCIREAKLLLKSIIEEMRKNNIPFTFKLPEVNQFWKDLYIRDTTHNIITVNVPDLSVISGMFKDKDYKINQVSGQVEVSTKSWKIVFCKSDEKSSTSIRFGDLSLPVVGNPGKALANFGKDACTKENVCFNILHEYKSLVSHKVWM